MGDRISRRNAHRLALHYAIAERDSFADATSGCGGGQTEKAAALANEFRRVLLEEFGEITAEDAFAAARHPSVSIFDLSPSDALKEGGEG